MRNKKARRNGAGKAPGGGRVRPPAADGELIYGWHSALAALRNPGRTVRQLLVTSNAHKRLTEIGMTIELPAPVDARAIERLTGPEAVHQGIAVLCDPLPEATLDVCAAAAIVVVLDQVTDPHNVGAVLRSAAAFGAGALVTTARHAPAESPVLAKAASGALEHVAFVRVPNLARALAELGDMDFLRVGLDSAREETIATLPPAERVALVLGAEGKGLRRLTMEHCDLLVRLPTQGPVASLNVSNAAAVALYAVARSRG